MALLQFLKRLPGDVVSGATNLEHAAFGGGQPAPAAQAAAPSAGAVDPNIAAANNQPSGLGRLWNDVATPVAHFATPFVQAGTGLASGAYHVAALPVEAARTATAEITGNQAAENASIKRAAPAGNFLKSLAQGIPRAAIQLGESVNPAGGDVYSRSFTPSNPVEKFVAGSAPIPTIQKAYKQTAATSGKAEAAGGAALTALTDALGGKQAADSVAAHAPGVATAIKNNASVDSIIQNHPAIQALNDHITQLDQARGKLTGSGLSENSAPVKANAAARVAAVQERTNTAKAIAQGGYAKLPGGETAPAAPAEDPFANLKAAGYTVKDGSVFDPTGKEMSVGDVQTANQNLSGNGYLSDFEQASKQGDEATMQKIAQDHPDDTRVQINQPKEVVPKAQTRGTIKTLKESPSVSAETKAALQGTPLVSRPHAPMREAAEQAVADDLQGATEKSMRDLQQTPGRMSDAQQMQAIKVAQAHDAAGNTATAQEIYSKLATHRTRTAQALAVGQELSKQTPEGMRYAAQKTLENAGVPFEGAVADAVRARLEAVKSTAPDSNERYLATQQLVNEVNQHLPTTFGDKAASLWRAGLLTGPETAAKVTTSHLITAPIELASKPVTAGVDAITSLFTGRRGNTFSPQDYINFLQGAKRGLGAAKTKITTGLDEKDTGGFDATMGQRGHQSLYEQAPYRLHGSIFKPNYAGAFDSSLKEQARTEAINQGLKGEERQDFIDKFVKDAPQSARDRATSEAENFTNMQKTAGAQFASSIQKFKLGNFPIGEYIAPFTRIPTAIASKGVVDWTPLGLGKAAYKMIDGIRNGNFDQRAFSQIVGRSLTGSAATTVVGYELMKHGDMTLAAPADLKERQLWLAQGKQPNSIKIGGKWWSLNAFGPAGISMGLGGAYGRSEQAGGSLVDNVTQALAGAGKLISDQPYLKGISGVANAINDPAEKAKTFVEQTAGSVIPAFLHQVAIGSDPYQRAYPNNIPDTLKAEIPGVREGLPAQHDIYGNTLPGSGGTLPKDVVGSINPFYTQDARGQSDAVTQELQGLYDRNGSGKSPAITPTTDITVNKQTVKLSPAQQQAMLSATGPVIHEGIGNLVNNSDYQGLSDSDKTAEVNKVINAAQDAYVQTSGLDPNKKLNAAATLAAEDPGQLGTSVSVGGTQINSGMDPGQRQFLVKTQALSTADRNKLFETNNGAEYQYNLAKWQNDQLNGTLTKAQDITTQQSLLKQQVGANFSKDTRDFYALTKPEIQQLITTDPNGKAIASQLVAYDNALVTAGLIKTGKFKNGFGSSSSGSGSSTTTDPYSSIDTTTPYKLGNLSSLHSLLFHSKVGTGASTSAAGKAPKAPKLKAKVATVKVSKKGKVKVTI